MALPSGLSSRFFSLPLFSALLLPRTLYLPLFSSFLVTAWRSLRTLHLLLPAIGRTGSQAHHRPGRAALQGQYHLSCSIAPLASSGAGALPLAHFYLLRICVPQGQTRVRRKAPLPHEHLCKALYNVCCAPPRLAAHA